MATGKRCAWRSQSRLFSIVGSVPGCAGLPGADAGADAAHAALQHLARHHVEHDRHRVAGLDVAEVVLGHVGADPEVVDGDQRHRRRAGLRELPDVGAQVGHQAAAGATTWVRCRSSSAFSTAERALISCAFLSPLSPAASWARRRSASAACSWLTRLDPAGLRDLWTRRTEIAPGSSAKICSRRVASCCA